MKRRESIIFGGSVIVQTNLRLLSNTAGLFLSCVYMMCQLLIEALNLLRANGALLEKKGHLIWGRKGRRLWFGIIFNVLSLSKQQLQFGYLKV